jgi:hypothetical protein
MDWDNQYEVPSVFEQTQGVLRPVIEDVIPGHHEALTAVVSL